MDANEQVRQARAVSMHGVPPAATEGGKVTGEKMEMVAEAVIRNGCGGQKPNDGQVRGTDDAQGRRPQAADVVVRRERY